MIRTAAAWLLLVLARWLLSEDAEESDDQGADGDGDEPEDAPCAVSFDWEGDVQSIEVLATEPADRLAVLLFVGQGRRISRGTELIGNG